MPGTTFSSFYEPRKLTRIETCRTGSRQSHPCLTCETCPLLVPRTEDNPDAINTFPSFSNEEASRVYAVLGVSSELDETLMFDPPCAIKTVLIPFEGQITYDSLLMSYPVSFGRNITARLNRTYQLAKKSGAIIESLERSKLTLIR